MEGPATVLVIDDHPIVREHIAQAMAEDERLQLAGQASDGEEALRKVDDLRPDAAVLDVEIPKLNGAEVLRALRAKKVPIKVLLYTGHAGSLELRQAVQAKPDGLLSKQADEDICDALVGMLNDELSAVARLNLRQAETFVGPTTELTDRDMHILHMSIQGRSIREIAGVLNVAPRTAEQLKREVCAKLGKATIEGAIGAGFALGALP